METIRDLRQTTHQPHDWLRQIRVAYVPGIDAPLLDTMARSLLERFAELGHGVDAEPGDETDVVFTTAAYGEPVPWRQALLFTARRRFGLKKTPVIYTLVQASPEQFASEIEYFEQALAKDPRDPADFEFEGLSPSAHRVLIEQGLRGGPILALQRRLQAQAKSIRVLLVVGEKEPQRVYHFDLVGAYPTSEAGDGFYTDMALRIVTTESTEEITDHEVVGDKIAAETWQGLSTPEAMRRAGQQLGERHFFTDMVRIEDLVHVPAVNDAVASQYSEGCFATWDPHIEALIATVTGSARPVDKGNIGDDDLAVIVGVRPDGAGAQVRHVDGKRNDPPSSEAVEMMDMDTPLPQVDYTTVGGVQAKVPVVRSKLHGHRGVKAFNPEVVEYVPLDPPYYHYLVSCATAAQARGIKAAFSRAECLNNPDDPRQIAFTVLPGHGVVVVEKWQKGKTAFQSLWEAMDNEDLVIDPHVPQGPMNYEAVKPQRSELREERA
jgi:hypothetical protein